MAELTTPFNLNLNLTELERITIDTEAIATDTDLSNIFYFAEIPQIPQARESNLQSLISTIEDCKAWETTRCEQSVQSQIAKGNLPGDSIVNIDTGVTAKFKVPATKPLNLAVVNTLINIEPLTANLPYRNFLKAVAAAFNPKVEMVQPYYHTVIGYQYDNVIEEFQADAAWRLTSQSTQLANMCALARIWLQSEILAYDCKPRQSSM
ncbi:hypothetical protein M7I_4832 [Glarea lozoyensis 74030]|uniref:Uncharacterized protein n=1 Tax=Glarea lozoyensis (strain ATCC 74030 / MF5533) TaxID=1104152 RepID=H0EQ86_GLAL7|nr:hypothetical protein M7I_4832 [Glarea lozoyensis 74030]